MADTAQSEFQRAFLEHARRVHRRRALRQALTGAGFGLLLGALGALGLWALRLGEWRPFAAGLGALGAVAGVLLAQRRRWSSGDVALFLDARLGSSETLTTALGARNSEEPALAHVVERAAVVLNGANPEQVKPRLWSRQHLAVPVALAAIAAISWAPLPPAPKAPAAPPGAERVRIENLKGLERIEALAQLRGQNPEQDERLKQLAEQARKLREALAKGLEKREALSEIAKLRDGVAAERLKLGDLQNRPGLDAALRAFANKALQDARKALSQGDLTAFDDEMQKLANRAENSDRKAAKDALEEAAKAAREKGSKSLADALDAQKKQFEEREARSGALRELSQSMKGKLSPEALEDLKEFGKSGDPAAEQRLEEALEKALEGLSADERKRLSERLQKQLEADAGQGSDLSPMTKKELESLSKQLASKAGVDALKKQLRDLSKPEPSADAKREQGLGDAERGGSAAERGLGVVPVPAPGDAAGEREGERSSGDGNDQHGPSRGNSDPGGSASPGSQHDTGSADHRGNTPEIAGKELRSKANAPLQAGAPMHGATLGRAPARAGETANERGSGSLGQAQKTEVGAVDHADIPEEYREQVGRYFEP